MVGWLWESWRWFCERCTQLWAWKREELQEEMGQNQPCLNAVSTSMEESKVHLSDILVDVLSEGGQEQSRDDIVSAIEKSKVNWSEIPGDISSENGAMLDMASSEIRHRNECIWRALQERDPQFFQDWSKKVKIGQKIGEGSQAEIFEASWKDSKVAMRSMKLVVKVFKSEGCRLEDFIGQWPCISSTTSLMDLEGYEQSPQFLVSTIECYDFVCQIRGAHLLEDGRFAFIMQRYTSDLRSLIDKKMEDNNGRGPPFPKRGDVKYILLCIAKGMQWLHNKDVLHRDLKAANVLVQVFGIGDLLELFGVGDGIYCNVADFECSISTLGTGFWRAPEVLQELQSGSRHHIDTWTKKSDVYSFGMICFEVLTGGIPLSECSKRNWNDVIYCDKRPKLPDYVDSTLQQLVKKCWDKDPLERPSFDDIVNDLKCWNKDCLKRPSFDVISGNLDFRLSN